MKRFLLVLIFVGCDLFCSDTNNKEDQILKWIDGQELSPAHIRLRVLYEQLYHNTSVDRSSVRLPSGQRDLEVDGFLQECEKILKQRKKAGE